jgi:hypothetical protein
MLRQGLPDIEAQPTLLLLVITHNNGGRAEDQQGHKDGAWIASGSLDRTVSVWRYQSM